MFRKLRVIEKCDCDVIHEDIVSQVRKNMMPDGKFDELADLFKALGDATRMKILWALNDAELCVCDISALLNMTQSAISHQLRVLKQGDLVKCRRDGKIIFYSLKGDQIRPLFNQGLMQINQMNEAEGI